MPMKRRVSKLEKTKNSKSTKTQTHRQEILRQLLLREKKEVIRDLEDQMGHQLNDDLQQHLDELLDSGDQATHDILKEMDLSFLEMRNKNLKAINEALERLKEGTYGICKECGAEIPEKRLQALPFASLCVACQEKQETLEKIEKEEERFK